MLTWNLRVISKAEKKKTVKWLCRRWALSLYVQLARRTPSDSIAQ